MRSFRASILWRKKGLPQALTRQLTVRLLGSRAVFMPPTVKVREVPVDFCCCNRIGYLETAAQASVNCHKFFDAHLIHRRIFHAIVPILAAQLSGASIPVEIPGEAIFPAEKIVLD